MANCLRSIAIVLAALGIASTAQGQGDTASVLYQCALLSDTNDLHKDATVVVVNRGGRYCLVRHGGREGFIPCGALVDFSQDRPAKSEKKSGADILKDLEERQRQTIEEYRASQGKTPERKAELIRKYGSATGTKIYDGDIWVGMTKQMAVDSWGEPDSKNRTGNARGIHEQWVYGNGRYLYFDNGTLTAWQQ